MSNTIYTLKRTSEEKLTELQEMLRKDFQVIGNIVYNNLEEKDNVEILLLVCEKYYYRNNSMTALTLQCVSNHSEQIATLVSTGGGTGVFNISWGANSDYALKAKVILKSYGFAEQN